MPKLEVRMKQEDWRRLNAAAKQAGVSRSEYVRAAIAWRLPAVLPPAVEEASGNRVGSPLGREPLEETGTRSGRAPSSPRPSEDYEPEWKRMLQVGRPVSSGPIPKGKR